MSESAVLSLISQFCIIMLLNPTFTAACLMHGRCFIIISNLSSGSKSGCLSHCL